jgi:hypothetical protein
VSPCYQIGGDRGWVIEAAGSESIENSQTKNQRLELPRPEPKRNDFSFPIPKPDDHLL